METEDNTLPVRLNQTQLAERLGVLYTTITNHRNGRSKQTLEAWSKKKDPQGIGWRYLPSLSQEGLDNFYEPVPADEEGEQDELGKQQAA